MCYRLLLRSRAQGGRGRRGGGGPNKTFHTERPRNEVANKVSSESVVGLPFEDDGKDGSTNMLEAVPLEYDKVTKKVIIEVGEEALTLEEGYKKVSIEKTV